MANPLLDQTGLPRFGEIRPEHVVAGIRELLRELGDALTALEEDSEPSWSGLVEPIEALSERLAYSWGIVGHLMGVQNSEALREAYETVQPEVVEFSVRFGQSRALFEGLRALAAAPAFARAEPAQKRIVEALLRDAELTGVGLEGEERERFNAIQKELAELSTTFSNHVLDATKRFALVLTEFAEVAGLPESLLQLAAQSAREAGEEGASAEAGPWRITLDAPSLQPFLQYSTRRDLRERLYRAYITRASQGELDNSTLIGRILALRKEQSEILGFENYASVSLSQKMAPDVAAVERLLEELRQASYAAAKRDLDALRALASANDAEGELAHWDVAYWAERLREKRFAYSEEDLRPYFPFPRVLDGLFDLASRLFDIQIRAADGEAPIWHNDVRYFRVFDAAGSELAAFYLDPYSRPAEKRGGAWMDECVARSRFPAGAGGTLRLPVAYLICNQTPPVGDHPSLMTFREVETLFHEFGHSLQHMLTTVDFGLASGIRGIEWDAVELPSQFMENWCYQRETLLGISEHVETGEPLPDDLFQKILAARTFRAGSDTLRQIYFGSMDLALHSRFEPAGDQTAFDVQKKIAEKTTVMAPLREDRFLCSFGHIFAGGYAAGYYSYKWAEVLSADAFAAFEEAGLDDEAAIRKTGRRFRDTVLALGGSRHPQEVFVDFRGREPSTEALLRHGGLAT